MPVKQHPTGTLPAVRSEDLLNGRFTLGRSFEDTIAHLLRRAGFGASAKEIAEYAALGYVGAVDRLVHFEQEPDVVDSWMHTPGYAAVVAPAQVASYIPNYDLANARSRWLFRMLYTRRPLQEKMALFWHNHFATGWSKIMGESSPVEATRMMAAVPEQDAAQQMGQIELLRRNALGNFYDILRDITRDPAMLYWLDGRRNKKAVPQENYGREVMELFTMGVVDLSGAPNYNEDDVKAAARVFTGWNLQSEQKATIQLRNETVPLRQYRFFYDAREHDTNAKTFSFPIYPNGSKTIPARPATQGAQDGLDFLAALVNHPSTAVRLAMKLYRFFVNDVDPPGSAVTTIAGWLQSSGFNMRAVMRQLFLSDFFLDEANAVARFAWPVEHVISTLKALEPGTRTLQSHLEYLSQMNELLFDPPSVEGYKAGAAWINSNSMLARANFVNLIAVDRKNDLVKMIQAEGPDVWTSPTAIVDYFLWRMGITEPDPLARIELIRFMNSGKGLNWRGTTTQLQDKLPGLLHLIGGTAEYAFV
jgi:uncharacterized protein (DUF1800 family)